MTRAGHVRSGAQVGGLSSPFTVEVVYVGSAGHLRRFKVLRAGRYVTGGLFRTMAEAEGFVADLLREERI